MASSSTPIPSTGLDSRPSISRATSDATSSLSNLSISPDSGTNTPTGVPISRHLSRSPVQEKSSSISASDSPVARPGFPDLHATALGMTDRGGSLEGNRGKTSSWYPGGAALSRPLSAPVASTSILAPIFGSTTSVSTSPVESPLSRTISAPSANLLSQSPTIPASTPRQIRPFSHPNASRPRASTSGAGSYPTARYVPIRNPPPQSPIRTTSGFSIAPSPPSTLQSHLYTSGLLESTLSDLHLVAFSHFYRLHRIVLGQSGFFSSLLAGGFSEERSGPARRDESEVIHVGMDCPLTRSAFEFCLARLYGGGPELVPPPWAQTSQEHPLSEMFERLWRRSLETKGARGTAVEDWEQVAAIGVQPATPTFLLSLLAQSTYLEIPSLQAKALQMIHSTLTPWTVGQYLDFSLGNGLGPFSSHLDLSAGLHGLEGVGTPYDLPRSRANTTSSSSSTSLSSSQFDGPFFVGPEGERVGEACACWLAKWGREILSIEEWLEKGGEEEGLPLSLEAFPDLAPPPLRVWSSEPGGLPARWVRGVISSDAFFLGVVGEAGEGEFARYLFARKVVELRRREKGRRKVEERVEERREKVAGESRKVASLRGMHGSTGTSVYELAGEAGESDFEVAMEKEESDEDEGGKETMKVLEEELVEEPEEEVEEDDKDEKEYAELFRTGIHYSQLTFKQLRFIAQDVSPTTGFPFAPKAIVEHAFWQTEDFKSRIPVGPTSNENQTSHAAHAAGPAQTNFDALRDGETLSNEEPTELGLTTNIKPALELKVDEEPGRYFLVPVDDTTRINDGPMPGAAEPAPKAKPSSLPTGAEAFFGLALETRSGGDGAARGVFGTLEEAAVGRRFVPYEPFRFSAEFWGVGELREKQRLYSETFFYGGSSYNIYLQKIQKKGVQLGIYLHRQNALEPFPAASSRPTSLHPASRSVLGELFGSPTSIPPPPPIKPPPYVDRRKSIQAFFSIWCPNQLGSTLTKFSSGPDTFALSQSWGWKSTSLAAALDLPSDTSGDGLAGRFSSLRVTLVMGIV